MKTMKLRLGFLAFIIFSFPLLSRGQSPYQLNWKQELYYVGTGAGTIGLGSYLKGQTPLFDLGLLETFNINSINSLDRGAIDNYSISSQKTSDWLLYGSIALPGLFIINEHTRSDFGTIAALWGETLLLNSGITTSSKFLFRRTRPFVYNPQFSIESKLTKSAQASFFSGHTSTTATNSFFVAKVFSDYFPDSKWKPVVWTVAAAIPALTGYFRVRAGKHYPTDVMVGYAVGAAIGYFVPHFHKRKDNKNTLQINASLNGLLINYKF